VSRESIELVNVLIPQGTDIVPLLRDEDSSAQALEALRAFLTDDFESVVVFGGQTRTRSGVEGLRENWLDWLEPWASYRVTVEDVIDAGEHVVALTRNYGRREDMEAEVELVAAAVFTLRTGKVARWEDYADRATALTAVGLSENVRTSS
jgi:ketosteroid isomerase-like protein